MTGHAMDNEEPGVRFSTEGIHFFSPQHPGRHRRTPDCQPSEDGAGRFSTSGSKVTNHRYRVPILQISAVLSPLPHNSSCDVAKRTACLPAVCLDTNLCLHCVCSRHEDCMCRRLTHVAATCPWHAVTTLQSQQPLNRI
jgi:hypothetical protein